MDLIESSQRSMFKVRKVKKGKFRIFYYFLWQFSQKTIAFVYFVNSFLGMILINCQEMDLIELFARSLLPRPRRGLRGIVFTLSVCVYMCVRPIFWYFISRLLEEISI